MKFNSQRLFVVEPPTFLFNNHTRPKLLFDLSPVSDMHSQYIDNTQAILTHGKYEKLCNRKTTGVVFVHSPYNMMYSWKRL